MSWEEKKGYFKIRQSQAGKRGRGGGEGTLKRELLDNKPQTQTT